MPAGVDRAGERAFGLEELASQLAASGVAPVLRVRRRPRSVRRVALVVSNTQACARLAHALIRSDLWRDATIVVVPVGALGTHTIKLAEAQALLLEHHGYAVQRAEGIGLDLDPEELGRRFQNMDAAVMGTLNNRRGLFGAVSHDAHEWIAERIPLILLP